jgi:precorrin-3B methylase
VVGIGPGNPENMSQRAVQTIKEADVVVGYRPYVELIEDVLSPEQEVIGSGMRQEVKRARKALDEALAGRRVVVVSSGYNLHPKVRLHHRC